MYSFSTLIALVGCSGFVIAATSLPVLAQAKPDAYVSVGPVIKETSPLKGRVEKVEVILGNRGGAPPADIHFTASMGVLTPTGQLVFESHGFYASLPAGSTLKAFQFQVAYPSPATQIKPKEPEKRGTGLKDSGPIAVQYTLRTHVSANKPCSQVESNCANNAVDRPLQFAVGGTPSCGKLQ